MDQDQGSETRLDFRASLPLTVRKDFPLARRLAIRQKKGKVRLIDDFPSSMRNSITTSHGLFCNFVLLGAVQETWKETQAECHDLRLAIFLLTI